MTFFHDGLCLLGHMILPKGQPFDLHSVSSVRMYSAVNSKSSIKGIGTSVGLVYTLAA
jgi:hypothetical protein